MPEMAAPNVPRLDPEKAKKHGKERKEARIELEKKYRSEAVKAFKQLKKGDSKTKIKEKSWVEKQVSEKMEEYDNSELIKLEDLVNRIPLEKHKLDILKKRIATAKVKLDKDPAEKKRRLMEEIEEQRQRKFYLERERILLTGDKGHIYDFKQKLADNKTKSTELSARKQALEKEKCELEKVSRLLENVDLSASDDQAPIEFETGTTVKPANFERKYMDLDFRALGRFRASGERAILDVLMRRYCEDLETLGRAYYARATAEELKLEDRDEALNLHIRNKQVKLKGLEDRRKEYHKKTADLDKQIATFTKGHEEVTGAVEELGEKLRVMERGHRGQLGGNLDRSEVDPKVKQLHHILEEATGRLSESSEERNKIIIGILLSYNEIKPISYRDADGKTAKPFQDAIGQIPWGAIEDQLGTLKSMFIKLTEEFKTYQHQFLDAKREANDGLNQPIKKEVNPGKSAKKSKSKTAKPSKKRIKKET